MNDEELMLLVKEYPNLYDLSHLQYHDNLVRDSTWAKIGKKLGHSADECRTKYKSLRECYRKAIRKREIKSRQGSKKMKPWRLESQMEFIRPYIIIQKDQVSNVELPSDEDNEQTTDTPENLSESHDLVASGSSATCDEAPKRPALRSGKKSKPASLTPSSATLKEVVELKKEKRTPTVPQTDHLTKYFQSVEETVRTFPPQLQIKIKSQISNIIHSAEFEAINMQSNSAPNFSHSAIHAAKRFSHVPYSTYSPSASLRSSSTASNISSPSPSPETLISPDY